MRRYIYEGLLYICYWIAFDFIIGIPEVLRWEWWALVGITALLIIVGSEIKEKT